MHAWDELPELCYLANISSRQSTSESRSPWVVESLTLMRTQGGGQTRFPGGISYCTWVCNQRHEHTELCTLDCRVITSHKTFTLSFLILQTSGECSVLGNVCNYSNILLCSCDVRLIITLWLKKPHLKYRRMRSCPECNVINTGSGRGERARCLQSQLLCSKLVPAPR